MVLVSGKLAAERVDAAAGAATGGGRDRRSRSRRATRGAGELNKRYGTTYYWSTYVLPAVKRHHVHALYGFCRYADDIVDDLGAGAGRRARAGAAPTSATGSSPTSPPGDSDDPVLQGGRPHGAGLRHRPRLLPPVPALDGDGPHASTLRDLGRPARLHGRLGGGDRRDDAADPRAASTCRGRRTPATSATPSSSRTSCATSARTSTAAASTCRRRTSAASAPTRAGAPVDAGLASS